MKYTQLVGGRSLLKLDRLTVEQVGFLAQGEQLIEFFALGQQLIANRGVAGQLCQAVMVCRQAQAGPPGVATARNKAGDMRTRVRPWRGVVCAIGRT